MPRPVAVANNSDYGLGSSLWTVDLSRAPRLSRQIQTGMVWINCYEESDTSVPPSGDRSSPTAACTGLEKYTSTEDHMNQHRRSIMSTTHHDAFQARLGEMGTAMDAQDLDALLAYYDDALVFIADGKEMDKAGLKDYVRELWSGESGFSVKVVGMHTCDDVIAVTLEVSAAAVGPSGENVTIHWPMFATYTFDLSTLKVVREVTFTDEPAVAEKFAAVAAA
jgi:ketosteroid isomerase-like protein